MVSGLTLNPMWIVPALAVAIVSMYATQGIIYTIPASFLQGKSAAMGIAAVTTMGILGGFAGPAWMGWMKDFTGSYQTGLMTLAIPCFVATFTVLNLKRRALVTRKDLVVIEMS